MDEVMPDRFPESMLHVDMDAFFVEVERLDDQRLVGKPVIVGGLGSRGVVASASYEARRRGVRSAMPVASARKRCPHAVFLPSRHDRYREVSRLIFDVLVGFTPEIEKLSIDEAFLDISGLRLHYPSAITVAEAIRSTIRAEVGVPASAGIAATKFVAKLASAAAKPNGVLLVRAGQEIEFLHPLPVRALWGVGEATHATLEGMAVRTIGDLAAVPIPVLTRRIGSTMGRHLAALARGEDPRSVTTDTVVRSVSVEETFSTDLIDVSDVERAVLALCDKLAGRLRRSGEAGRTVTLKVRYGDFSTITRSQTSSTSITTTAELWDISRRLLIRTEAGERPVRLLGIGVASLEATGTPAQLAFDQSPTHAASTAAEQVRARFGDEALRPARLLTGGSSSGDGSAGPDGKTVQS
jgi:DNA polymerase-4